MMSCRLRVSNSPFQHASCISASLGEGGGGRASWLSKRYVKQRESERSALRAEPPKLHITDGFT